MRKFAGTVFLFCFCLLSFSQIPKNIDSLTVSVEKYLSAVDKKSKQVEGLISSKSLKYIKKLKKSEQSLQNIVAKKDSLLALQLFGGVKQKYDDIQGKMKGVEKNLERVTGSYIPLMDSLNTSLKFLKKIDAGKIKQLDGVMENFDQLQSKLNTSLQFDNFLKERQKLISDKLASFGLLKEFKKYRQQAFYYSQQVREFKEALNEPDKVIATSLQYLQKVPAFAAFYKKNSMLSSLFQLPGGMEGAESKALAGLQTRVEVQGLINQRQMGNSGSSQDAFQGQLDKAKGKLEELKTRVNNHGGMGNSDEALPEFKPNNQKTKSLWSRLEIGTNFQTTRSTYLFPTTTDFGLSVGYKLNDRSILGVGLSYKMGWGESYKNIKITHQGAGLRSFVDVKVKGSIYISGGFEMNYKKEINNIDQLKEFSAWQNSGLIGATKKFQLNKKIKGNIQLLWDFMSYQQVPRTQPILFRVGYYFK